MPLGFREPVELSSNHPYRVLRWKESFQNMELLVSRRRSVRVPGGGNNWHYHRAYQLTHFSSGRGTRFVGDHIAPFSSGDLVLVGENLPHYWHTQGPSSGLSVQWSLPASHPLWMLAEAAPLLECFEKAARGIHFRGRTAETIAMLLRALAASDDLARLGLLLQIFSTIAGAPPRDQARLSSQIFSLAAESRHQRTMQAAVEYLLAHYQTDIRLQQVLEVTHMSKPTFSRVFKTHSGKTLNDFLQQIRLDAACRELTETDNPIIEIALNSGFSQISFFNRVFQRRLKCTPSEYRKHSRARQR